jgi:pyruvate dehydrogenase E2 component (dihydrolipoamide acetyltransferase)
VTTVAVELRMPGLGMTMEEGRIVAWRVNEGDQVARGQILVEIESEKVAYEVEAPADGIVGKILAPVDAVVPVGAVLVSIRTPGTVSATVAETAVTPTAGTAVPARPGEASAPAGVAVAPTETRRRLSPRARRLAENLGVDFSTVVGTGPDGTIVEEDIRAAAQAGPARPAAKPVTEPTPSELRPLTPMRRTIAERMAESARSAPHFFLAVEVDGSAVLAYRALHGPRLEAETGIKPTLTDLLLYVTAQTLVGHPSLNASYTPEGIREWRTINLGLAVALDDGLIVPVIHGTERKSLGELVACRADLVARARARTLGLGDLRGGTFTFSNLGALGIDFFTSILNPPQAGIVSVGMLTERPVVVGGSVVARPTMHLGLTIDHRVTDGAAGARFLAELRARIEAAKLNG